MSHLTTISGTGVVQILWRRAKEKCRIRKYIRFLILFIPRSCECKRPFRGFSEILIQKISIWIYIIFHILTQPKNYTKKKCYKIQRHSLFRHGTGLMKSKIVKVKLVWNYFPPITEFSILVGHPNVHFLSMLIVECWGWFQGSSLQNDGSIKIMVQIQGLIVSWEIKLFYTT